MAADLLVFMEEAETVANIKVMVVDDSAFMRQVISKMLEKDPDIQVVGIATDGLDALNKVEIFQPDIITLDIEMPKMDGLTCLAKLMETRPLPVVMVSSWAVEGGERTLKALELGAVDFVTKPSGEPSDDLWEIEAQLIEKVKAAAKAKIERLAEPLPAVKPGTNVRFSRRPPLGLPRLLAIGASTGGPRAIQSILTSLPSNLPVGIVIGQHMPKDFTKVFAGRLNSLCALQIREAQTGDEVKPGQVLIAPSGHQLAIQLVGSKFVAEVTDVSSIYKPSIDFLFQSLTTVTGGETVAVLLTGMGGDGARGLKALRDLGARTIVESEESCVVYGMPRVAWEMGAGEFSLPLDRIPAAILDLLRGSYGKNQKDS